MTDQPSRAQEVRVARSYDGTALSYTAAGSGPWTLLFFHGWGGSRRTWEGVLNHLDLRRFRCLCLDWRGHGSSARPAQGYNWEGFRRDALAVADAEGAERFIPVGFSMGARLACYLAAQCPERIPAQILVAMPSLGTLPIERELGLRLCREAADWRQIKPFFRNLWFAPSCEEAFVDSCCQSVSEVPGFVLAATAEMLLWSSLEQAIGRLQLPTLLVCGSDDPLWPPSRHEEHRLRYFPQARLAVTSASHFVPLECPRELAAEMEGFLDATVTKDAI